MKMENPILYFLAALMVIAGGTWYYQERKRKQFIAEPNNNVYGLTGIALAVDSAKQAGFSGESLVTAIAIAQAESDFDPEAEGDINLVNDMWGSSVGLWQIRSLINPYVVAYPDSLRVAIKLYDPYYNARAAYAISDNGRNFQPWTTYVNGKYLQFVNGVRGYLNEQTG